MSTFAIKIDGTDVTASVIIKDASFTSAAKGAAGEASFRLRDEAHLYAFATGDSLTLDVDGERVWTGYVAQIERGYFFEADCRCRSQITPRYLRIIGTDVNVLLHKRVLYNKDDGAKTELTRFDPDTFDSTVLSYYLQHHTDILSDGVTRSLIEHVGTPSTDSPISGAASWTINDLCRYLTYNTGAIYYIDPDKVFVLTDVDTPNSPYTLTDTPGQPFSDDFERVTTDEDLGNPRYSFRGPAHDPGTISVNGDLTVQAESGFAFWDISGVSSWGILQFDFFVPSDPTADSMYYELDGSIAPWQSIFYAPFLFAAANGDGDWEIGLGSNAFEQFTVPLTPDPSEWYTAKGEFRPDLDIFRVKVWKRSDPEPDWQAEGTLSGTPDSDWFSLLGVGPGSLPGLDAKMDNLLLSGTGTQIGYRDVEIDFDGSGLRNDALAWGVGQGATEPVFGRSTSQESIDEHGLWQVGDFNQAIWKQATIQHVAHTYVFGSPQSKRGGKDDRISVKLTVFRPDFRVAQKVRFESQVFGYADVIPIRMQKITFPTHQDVQFDLILSHDIDDPWSTSQFWFPTIVFPPPPIYDPHWWLPPPVFPPPILPPSNPCHDTDGGSTGCCRELFLRQDLTGWGDSELNSGTYSNTRASGSGSGAIGVPYITTPGFGVLPLPNPCPPPNGSIASNAETISFPTAGLPFEMLIVSELDAPPPGARNGLEILCDLLSTVPGNSWRWAVGPMTNNFGELGITVGLFGGIGGATNRTTGFSLPGFSSGRELSVRMRAETDGVFVKAWWSNTDAEPDQWDATIQGITPGPVSGLKMMNVGEGGGQAGLWTIKKIEVCEGMCCNGNHSAVSCTAGEPMEGACYWDDFDRGSGHDWGSLPSGLASWQYAGPSPEGFSFLRGDQQAVLGGYGDTVWGGGGPSQFATQFTVQSIEFDDPETAEADCPLPFLTQFQLRLDSDAPPNSTVLSTQAVGEPLGYVFAPGTAPTSGVASDRIYASFVAGSGISGTVNVYIYNGQWYVAEAREGSAYFYAPVPLGIFWERDKWLNVRFEVPVENDRFLWWFWRDGETQPLNPTIEHVRLVPAWTWSEPMTHVTTIRVEGAAHTVEGHSWRLRAYNFDSCQAADQPIPDTSERRVCETLTRINTPSGQSEDWAYYQTSYGMAFGSDEVWVDGLRIDSRDYAVVGSRNMIGIYDRLSVGGLDASDPPKTVHACYIATSIEVA